MYPEQGGIWCTYNHSDDQDAMGIAKKQTIRPSKEMVVRFPQATIRPSNFMTTDLTESRTKINYWWLAFGNSEESTLPEE